LFLTFFALFSHSEEWADQSRMYGIVGVSYCHGALVASRFMSTHPIIAKPLDHPLFAARKEGNCWLF
jgi:hypothetical protein